MKKATLSHDDQKGFILIDEEENFIMQVEAGELEEEVNWELIEKQANELNYSLD